MWKSAKDYIYFKATTITTTKVNDKKPTNKSYYLYVNERDREREKAKIIERISMNSNIQIIK